MKKNSVLKPTSANVLTQQVIKVLSMKNYHVWRQNNGAVYDPTLKKFRANSSTPGIPDVLGFNKSTGRFVCAEIKAGKDRLSKEQKEFMMTAAAAGCMTFVIKTSEDIENMIKALDYADRIIHRA